ncbi:hypothetical protein J4480_05415 [Candidatus Woesearchaeota archaeon]|nr:hypothetical protein [Candidatus Woesearchaeota archaeon]
MEVDIRKGIDDTINSKVQIFHEKTRNGIVLFEKDKFPKILNSSYDPLILNIINCSFIIKNNLNEFFSIIEPFVEFNQVKNIFEIEDSKVSEFKKTLSGINAMSGIELLEIMPADGKSEHQVFLNKIGANASSLIVKGNGNILNLQNFNSKINKKFDITFSNNLLHDNSSIEDEKHSNSYRSMELYAVLSNFTKKGGYSIHCHGAYISSLHETYFQFLGFKVIDYFRVETGPYNFGIILKKLNNKEITSKEFDYLYAEMKKRNPIRYR